MCVKFSAFTNTHYLRTLYINNDSTDREIIMNTQENTLLRDAIRCLDRATEIFDELGLSGMADHTDFCAVDASILIDDDLPADTPPAQFERVQGNCIGVYQGGCRG